MEKIMLAEAVQVNPPKLKTLNVKADTIVGFLPMDAVSNDGRITRIEEALYSSIGNGFTSFQDKDVLLAKITPCMENGKGALVSGMPNGIGFGSTEFHVLRPSQDKISPEYLYYITRNPKFRQEAEKNMTGSAGQKRVPADFLRNYIIPLPPLPEQKRIVETLDKAQRLIDLRKKQIEEMDRLAQAMFIEMFGDPVRNEKGWDTCRLDEISEIVSGVAKGRKLTGDNVIEYPYLRVANVKDGFIDITEIKKIEAYKSEVEKYRLKVGDILLTEGGDPDKLGRGAVWRNPSLDCIHQNHIFRVRISNDNYQSHYLSALIGSPYGKMYFLRAAKQTTGIASINMTQLSAFPVLIAPEHLQEKYMEFIDSIEIQKKSLNEGLSIIKKNYNALAQEFVG